MAGKYKPVSQTEYNLLSAILVSIISASRKLGKSSLYALLRTGQKRKQLTFDLFGKENENQKNELQVKVYTHL